MYPLTGTVRNQESSEAGRSQFTTVKPWAPGSHIKVEQS